MKKAALHFSGGKDAVLSLYKLLREENIEIVYLITTLAKPYNRVSMHGIREELIERQAESLNIPLIKIWLPEMPTMEAYETALTNVLKDIKQEGIEYSVFGDIFLEDIKKYREKLLEGIGVKCLFPLWKMSTYKLSRDFIREGFFAKIVSLNALKLEKTLCGSEFDIQFLDNLPHTIDPCGENGEFHTFVYDGPIFSNPVHFKLGKLQLKDYKESGGQGIDTRYWFIDLVP